MSQEVSQVRINASKVSTMLKQGSLRPAVQAVRNAVHLLVTCSLIRAEQDDLKRIVEQGCNHLANSKEIRAIFPLVLQYAAGEEQELLKTLDSLLEVLDKDASDEALKKMAEMELYKKNQVAKGSQELNEGRVAEAKVTFTDLKNNFPNDAALAYEIATTYMDAGFYEEATHYGENALALAPNNISLLNRLGISLRKMKKFNMAEAMFLSALAINDIDANLHFNLGRVYLEWGKLEQALESAKKACALNPSFEEAQKLGVYLQKKLQNA